MRRSSFRTALLSVLAILALLLAACGVDGGDGAATSSRDDETAATGEDPPEDDGPEVPEGGEPGDFQGTGGAVFLNRAAETTTDVRTQKMEMTMKTIGGPMPIEVLVTGEVDLERNLYKMDLDLGATMGPMFDTDELEGLDGLEGFEGLGDMLSMTMIMTEDEAYLKSPMLTMFSADPAEWVVMSLDEVEEFSDSQQTQDPNDFLEFLKATDAEVTELGREEVRGVDTQHLATELDFRAIIEQADADERAELEEALDGLGTELDSIPIEVWIDDDGYVRRMMMSFDLSDLGDTEGMDLGRMEMTIDLFDFNEPVDIELPDPADVVELDESMFDLEGMDI